MTRADKQKLILAAYNYNADARQMGSCNRLYMGSMATCMLFAALGGDWPKQSLEGALECATEKQLDAGLAECSGVIKYAGLR